MSDLRSEINTNLGLLFGAKCFVFYKEMKKLPLRWEDFKMSLANQLVRTILQRHFFVVSFFS